MADAKIEFRVGSISFLCEGEKDWVTEQFGGFIKSLPEISKSADDGHQYSQDSQASSGAGDVAGKSLASFLKEKNASSNQIKKFLTTAVWLHSKGDKRLTTSKISKALSQHQQGRLSNPTQSLNYNLEKGHCVKEGNEFYVTPEGYQSL